ncbi:MAG: hypothetical protein ACHQWU_08390 [Gemmatimonadales bacterium]
MTSWFLLFFVQAQRTAMRRGHPHLPGMAFQLATVLDFALLVGAAILMRRRGDMHKRLMLLACLSILLPGIVRIPLHAIESGGLFTIGILYACVLVCAAVDAVNHRRLHPAFVWGGLLIILSQPLGLVIGATHAWTHFAARLVS